VRRDKTTISNRWRHRVLSAALVSMGAIAGNAAAFEIDTGNPDIELRWDNTLRYSLGVRTQKQDSAILANPNADDGDRNFKNRSVVANRFDVLSEFDLVWQKNYGARMSVAAWWDPAYGSLDNTSVATANTLSDGVPVAGKLSPFTKRYAKGPSAEWLDAFAFANVDVAGVPVKIKAGQHTVYWGESLLLGGVVHGIAYSQNSVDLWKGLATPGTLADGQGDLLATSLAGVRLPDAVTDRLAAGAQPKTQKRAVDTGAAPADTWSGAIEIAILSGSMPRDGETRRSTPR
jgi:Protein of unknown function (DUF1302)